MAIRGVVFDVDGTLYRQRPLRAWMALLLSVTAAGRPKRTWGELKMISHYRRAQEWLRARSLPVAPTSQLERASETSGASTEEIRAAVANWMERRPAAALPLLAHRGLRRRIETWSGLGVPMAVYSDYPAAAKLARLGLDRWIAVAVCSTDSDVMSFKPSPKGFEVAARRIGLSPSEVAYVGDREEVDGVGARRAGMLSFLVGGAAEKESLSRLDDELRRTYPPAAPCWVCGSGETASYRRSTLREPMNSDSVRITDSDYGQTFALAKCRTCGFVFANPTPGRELLDLYRHMEDPEYQATSAPRRRQMRGILDSVRARAPQAKSLLDIGAGIGLMVAEAAAAGLDAAGVEPSRWSVETAERQNGISLFCGTLEECAGRLARYDLVFLIDVIEHVTDPVGLLREAANFLNPSGAIVIVTPDIGSLAARALGSRWWHFRPGHVGYFDERSMDTAFRESGLQLVESWGARWHFPVPYVVERLERYAPRMLRPGLRRAARSPRLAEKEITLRLGDSTVYLARKST